MINAEIVHADDPIEGEKGGSQQGKKYQPNLYEGYLI